AQAGRFGWRGGWLELHRDVLSHRRLQSQSRLDAREPLLQPGDAFVRICGRKGLAKKFGHATGREGGNSPDRPAELCRIVGGLTAHGLATAAHALHYDGGESAAD